MNMNYKVKLTNYAIEQMSDIVSYISKTLRSPENARSWSAYVKKGIATLSLMPERLPLIQEEPWRSEGVRRLVIKNFLVYFWIDELQQIVWVIGIIYGKREQLSALENMPLSD